MSGTISREALEAWARAFNAPGTPARPLDVPTRPLPADRRRPRETGQGATSDAPPQVTVPGPGDWLASPPPLGAPPMIPPGMFPPGAPPMVPPRLPTPGQANAPRPPMAPGATDFLATIPPNVQQQRVQELARRLEQSGLPMVVPQPPTPIGIPPRPGQPGAVPEFLSRQTNPAGAADDVAMPQVNRSLRERLAAASAALGAGGLVLSVPGSTPAVPGAPPAAAGGEVVPPSAPVPQTAPANAAAPTMQDLLTQRLMQIALGGGGGGGGGGFRPQEITRDMLPNWQAVRDANAAARPEAPEQVSAEDMRRNVLLAFLGSFEQRPGERLGAAFARQGGAAGRARTGTEEQNRQTRDVTRREQQAYRQGQAALEAQIQAGQSQSLISMLQANNAARAQAAQLAQAGGGRSLQALMTLAQMQDPSRQIAPEYLVSRIAQQAADSRNPMVIPGVDAGAARQAALASLPPTERNMVVAGQPNPAFQQAYAMEIARQIATMPPEQQARLLQGFRPLATTRPSANARVGEQ